MIDVFKNILRVGIIESVNYASQTCKIRMYDRLEPRGKLYTCPLPHPSAGINSGIFHYPEKGSVVLVGWGDKEMPLIVASIPNSYFVQDLTKNTNASNLATSDVGYPYLKQGEVALSGPYGSLIKMTRGGGIELRTQKSFLHLSNENKAILNIGSLGEITESSLTWKGLTYRDLRQSTSTGEETENKKTSLSYFRVLDSISRDPGHSSAMLTTAYAGIQRNPPFVEERKIIKEFADSAMVGTTAEEIDRLIEQDNSSFLRQPNRRDQAIYDVLNLNLDHPNYLIEKVEGTVVDIYGNVLDLNRNVINYPSEDQSKFDTKSWLQRVNALSRRAIKFHYEINSRKDTSGDVAIDVLDGPDIKNGHSHSRWSIDVDGEGLTKINIPASSNIGNIPLLSRFVTSHMKAKRKDVDFRAGSSDQDSGDGVDENGRSTEIKDILHMGFGFNQDEIEIPHEYAPADLVGEERINYRTAYHSIINTASLALNGFAIANSINNKISEPGQMLEEVNAGGRSLFANLDGSMELNVGRDAVDHKSVVLDLSGGIVSRVGKTKASAHSASIISQLDGSVYIQVGGDTVEGDEVLTDPKVKLVVSGSTGTDIISIDEKALKIEGAYGKNIVISSKKNIVLEAAGSILLAGSNVGVHGSADENGDGISPKRLIVQNGKEI